MKVDGLLIWVVILTFVFAGELVRCVENQFTNGSETQENEPGITVLYTGFGPFRDHVINSSWEAVSRIPEHGIALPPNINPNTPIKIVAYYLPVVYQLVADVVPKLWAKHQPDLVIHVGVSGIAKAITVEQNAHNCGYSSPDITDCIPTGNVCVVDGCDVIESGFNMREVVGKVNSRNCGIRAEIFYDPGRYLCDFTYYQSLSIDKERTAFIHVPPLNKPWGAEDLAQAVSLCTSELLRQLQDRNALSGIRGTNEEEYKLERNQL